MTKRYDLLAEQAVLAAILLDNTLFDDLSLSASTFYDPKHMTLYRVMGEIIESGRPVNDVVLYEELLKRKVDIPASYIAGLTVPTTANVVYYAESIKKYAAVRMMEKLLLRVSEKIEGGDVPAALQEIEKNLLQFSIADDRGIKELTDVLPGALGAIENQYHNRGGYTGIPSGFKDLDYFTNGFQNGELIIIGARPSVGKTAFALTTAVNMAKAKIPVGFVSCEMSAESLIGRVLAGEGRVNMNQIRSGYMEQKHFDSIVEACDRLYGAPLLIADTPNVSLSELKSKARQMRRRGARVLFVDYITLIRHENTKLPRNEQVGDTSKSLKQLARELEIPIVVLSQVGRDAEGRMPTLADLRWSGEIEEDSDVIIFLHRKGEDRVTKLHIAKNRNGATGTTEIIFIPPYVKFENKAREGIDAKS